MVSRNTEKKGKGNRKRSFKKRKMTGGKNTWDYNNPTFIPFQQITPSNPCEWDTGIPVQNTSFKKLVEYAYTNNTDAFIHTIQCCFGWKGHSTGILNTIGLGSNVSRSAQNKTNYFAATGFAYLFERTGTTTLLHIAAAWGNDIIIEILLNVAKLNFVYASDPLVKNSKISEEEYNSAVTVAINGQGRATDIKGVFNGIDTPYHSLYAKQVSSGGETQLDNEINLSSYKISSNPIRCELLFLQYNSGLTTLSVDPVRAATVNELIMGTPYELLYDMDGVRYMPAMVKCTATGDAIDDKFCPYVASGTLGTSSATGIISSESDKICALFVSAFNAVNRTNQVRDFLTTKICDVLFHYAFRDDQAAFNKILKCATNLYPDETDELCSILQSRTQQSNGTQYTLLHIGAIYGNINIVQPLIGLYKSCNDDDVKLLLTRTATNAPTTVATNTPTTVETTTVATNELPFLKELKTKQQQANSAGGYVIPPPPPSRTPPQPHSMTIPSPHTDIHFPSVLECLYTRSDVKLSIFYGAARKSTPSDSYSVQQLFNDIICSGAKSNTLCNDYTNMLTEIYSDNYERIGTIVAELNRLDAGSWISKKSILTYTSDADGNNVKYASFMLSDKLTLIDGTTKFAAATGNIAMQIGSAVKDFGVNAGSVVKDLGINASSAVKGGLMGGVTYVTNIDGSLFWGAWDAITGQLTVMRDRAAAALPAAVTTATDPNAHPYKVITNTQIKFGDSTSEDASSKIVAPTMSAYAMPDSLYVFKNQKKPMLYNLVSKTGAAPNAVDNDAPHIISFDATGAYIVPALLVRNSAITSDNVFLLTDAQNTLIIQTKADELIRYNMAA